MSDHAVFDTIVIGGGISGLVCARDLKAKGNRVVVLEARQRVGGRLFSKPFRNDGPVIELGGAYFRPVEGSPIHAEAARYNLELRSPPPPTEVLWYVAGEFQTTADLLKREGQDLERAFFRILTDVERFPSDIEAGSNALADLDIPASEYLDALSLPQATHDFLSGWATQYSGTDLSSVSAVSLLALVATRQKSIYGLMASNAKVFTKGTGALIDAIASELEGEIRLGVVVKAIRQTDDSVVVETESGDTFKARNAVCAVPVNTLSSIEFEPPLPQDQAAVAQDGQPCRGVKICVSVGGVENAILRVGMGGPLQLVQTVYKEDDLHLVVGFGIEKGGPDATDFNSVAAAVNFLVPEASVLEMDVHDWNADPFAAGAWATYRPGEITKLAALRTPHGRLAFAGADCATTRGVDGALHTGAEAAKFAMRTN